MVLATTNRMTEIFPHKSIMKGLYCSMFLQKGRDAWLLASLPSHPRLFYLSLHLFPTILCPCHFCGLKYSDAFKCFLSTCLCHSSFSLWISLPNFVFVTCRHFYCPMWRILLCPITFELCPLIGPLLVFKRAFVAAWECAFRGFFFLNLIVESILCPLIGLCLSTPGQADFSLRGRYRCYLTHGEDG